jgi:ATP-dependent helicase HrpB
VTSPHRGGALPVDRELARLVAALRSHHSAVVVAPTGSGKSTRVAPALLDAFGGRVWLLQPRRVAARALARRIAFERGCAVGDDVGYRVRMERVESRATRLVVATTGAFLAHFLADQALEGTSVVVLDEFHERSLECDLVLALVAEARAGLGLDVRLVCMSATLDHGPIARFLGDAPVVAAEGRAFDVAVEYLPALPGEREDDHAERAVREWLLPGDERGDALVFLPGAGEVRRLTERLAGPLARSGRRALPLYGELSSAEQDAVFEEGGNPKIVFATNVAETSLTLPGVTRVIDSGRVRRARHDALRGLTRLELERASRASLEQRKGRAGRVAPGRCLRLFAPLEERAFPEREEPEVLRADLCDALLVLARVGADPRAFAWFEAPPAAALASATSVLEALGALARGRITPRGERLARLPLHPRLAALMVAGEEHGAPVGAATAAALLSERDPFEAAGGEPVPVDSDVVERVRALWAFERGRPLPRTVPNLREGPARRVLAIRDELLGSRRRGDLEGESDAALCRAVAEAWIDRLCVRRTAGEPGARYLGGGGVELAPTSRVLEAELFVAVELAQTKRGNDPSVRLASRVERAWLDPAGFASEVVPRFDRSGERVVEELEERWRGLVLSRRDAPGRAAPGAVEAVLAEAAALEPERALDLVAEDVQQWLARVACLAEWCPELELPAFDQARLGALAASVASGCRSFAQMRRVPLVEWLENDLSRHQRQQLHEFAPTHIEVPSGSRIRLAYERGRPPVLAVRIQELFGLARTPSVARGRVPVLLHLLAPNGRPQQVTADLASFWRTAYHEVRKELRRRYPKHAWPDDPATAPPQRRPGRGAR